MKWIYTRDIVSWATRRDCQENIPLLVRKLIRATSKSIKNIKFPAGDNVLIGGWDGILEVLDSTEYLPNGLSLWEFGTSKDVKGKADSDYEKRTNDSLGFDTADATFIFVTPRLWTKGEEWKDERLKEGKWKDIQVINAEVLEEWIETAPTVGTWLAKHLSIFPKEGVQSTDDFWETWSAGTEFNLPAELFLGGRKKEIEQTYEALQLPSILPVQGMSRDEALAFIISCFKSNEAFEEDFFARSLIIDNIDSFRMVSLQDTPLILIPRFEEDNGVINKAFQNGHTIIVPLGIDAPNNWTNKIELPQISRDGFVDALKTVGLCEEFAEKYSKESARNISILRRQLNFNRALPLWATPENVADIIPALLVGRWNENYEEDKAIISQLANDTYENYVAKINKWVHISDSPILKIGSTWRLTSPFDAWTNSAQYITGNDFDLLHKSVLIILSEINPVFELESEQRKYAGLMGKNRAFSSWIREGVLQSLILTSILGSKFKLNLPTQANVWVDKIVYELLDSEDSYHWKSLENKLPLIAEASPKAFLDSVSKYLEVASSPIVSLFEESPGFMHETSYHTGLLWALEGLAWFPEYFSRAVLVLAKLADIDPGGRLSNRPINSLKEIFKPWYYQTLASFEERIQVLKLLSKKESRIAWKILAEMLPTLSGGTASPTAKSRWRMFDQETKRSVTYQEIYDTHSEVVDILISEFEYNEEMLSVLIQKTQGLIPCDRDKIIQFTSEKRSVISHPGNLVWHELRKLISHHRSCATTDWAFSEEILKHYDDLYSLYEPEDVIGKSIWMFDGYPEFSDAHSYEELPMHDREQIVTKRREDGLRSIYENYGIEKIIELSNVVNEKWDLGRTLSHIVDNELEILKLCTQLQTEEEDLQFINGFLVNKCGEKGLDWIANLFVQLEDLGYSTVSLAQLLIPLPQSMELWNYIDLLDSKIREFYWMKMVPNFYRFDLEGKEFGLKKLLDYKRFFWATDVCYHFVDELSSNLIFNTLNKLATEESCDKHQFRGYEINRIFKSLNKREDLEHEKIVQLEWLFLPILTSYNSSHKPKRLHREIAENPKFFIDIIKWAFLPKNRELLKDENKDVSDDVVRNRAKQAHQLLDSWKKIPGVSEVGEIDKNFLFEWTRKSRELACNVDRLNVADSQIGKVLAQYPEDYKSVWPPKEICELIEDLKSDSIERNFSTAVYNKRGSTCRGPFDGGDIERGNAEYFERLAKAHRNMYPIVSSVFEKLSSSYLEQAKWEDERAERDKLDY